VTNDNAGINNILQTVITHRPNNGERSRLVFWLNSDVSSSSVVDKCILAVKPRLIPHNWRPSSLQLCPMTL